MPITTVKAFEEALRVRLTRVITMAAAETHSRFTEFLADPDMTEKSPDDLHDFIFNTFTEVWEDKMEDVWEQLQNV